MPEEPKIQEVTLPELAQISGLAGELALVDLGHPVLRAPARPLAREAFGSPELAKAVAALWRTLDAIGHGVGLAAPQVGWPFALFCLDDREGTRLALVNPHLLDLPGAPDFIWVEEHEGCLSVPGFWGRVRRPASLSVAGLDLMGKEVVVDGHGFLARILAHESDHLVGRLYLDLAESGTFAPEDPASLPGGFIFYTPPPRASFRTRTR